MRLDSYGDEPEGANETLRASRSRRLEQRAQRF